MTIKRKSKLSQGLIISEDSFRKMKSPQQMLLLYKNTEEIKSKVDGYKFQQKVLAVTLSGLTIAVGFLFKMLVLK